MAQWKLKRKWQWKLKSAKIVVCCILRCNRGSSALRLVWRWKEKNIEYNWKIDFFVDTTLEWRQLLPYQRDFFTLSSVRLEDNKGRISWSTGPQGSIYSHEIAFTFLYKVDFTLDSVILYYSWGNLECFPYACSL